MKTELQTNQHLIQEFMGVEKTERLIPYHSCWNHLMLVVEKIEDIEIDDSFYDVEIRQNVTYIHHADEDYDHYGFASKLDSVYYAKIQFIKYYNQNK